MIADRKLITFRGVTKRYGGHMAVEGVDLALRTNEILGLVGESGSGKTTCVRLALGLEQPSSGEVLIDGCPFPTRWKELKGLRRRVSFVFQDPYDSLDPRMSIGETIAEPMRVHGVDRREAAARVAQLLVAVGLPDAKPDSRPDRFSGGGRQRIAIARGLALDPEILICDEPTASLDVSVQAQIVNLLLRLKSERGLSVLFISHNLRLVARICDRVAVMREGRVVEQGPTETVRNAPQHPYTQRLLEVTPADHPRGRRLRAALPTIQEQR